MSKKLIEQYAKKSVGKFLKENFEDELNLSTNTPTTEPASDESIADMVDPTQEVVEPTQGISDEAMVIIKDIRAMILRLMADNSVTDSAEIYKSIKSIFDACDKITLQKKQ